MNTMADGEREKFEAWCFERKWNVDRSTGVAAYYKDDAVLGAWEAWQYLAARQPVGQIVGYMDPDADFMLARHGDCVLMGNIVLWREPGSKYTKPLYDAPPAQGWVVADGQGARWRMWGSCGPEWTSDRDQALHFARRADAEAFANDDEDAWLIQPVGAPAQAVDLGQFQRLADSWLHQADRVNSASPLKAVAMWACAKELRDMLALIDSKAVGNG